jgi:putative FmdB family regulatory protein
MPTYDYRCDACEHQFEEFQSMSEPPLKKCPQCGKKKLRRLFGTGAAVLFKGAGFYQTDYRSDSYKAAAKAEAEKTGSKKAAGSNDGSGANGTAKSDSGAGSAAKKAKSAD